MNKIKTTLLIIVGRIKKMSTLFLALGTMFAPLAVVVGINSGWGVIFALVGIASIILGWVYVIKEEKQRTKEHKLRVRREKSMIIFLAHITDKSCANMAEVADMLKDKLDDE